MSNAPTPYPYPITLRSLPLSARLTLALFLISVGIGYFSALVQLHFQHATPGSMLPTGDDAERVFVTDTGKRPKTKIEALLPESDKGPMNGQGQMTAAFTKRSEDWDSALSAWKSKLVKERGGKPKDHAAEAEAELRKERDAERLAMIAWIQAGASEEEFTDDRFPLPGELAFRPMTKKYLVEENGQLADPRLVKIKTLFEERCATCHGEGGSAQNFPLKTYTDIKKYVSVPTGTAMSVSKLAQTTHVHLLGFAMLYGLTGLILSFSTYPRLLRIVLCPLPLLVQIVDISFWWLARLPHPHGPVFARAIVVSGAIVAVGLFLHIVLGLFNLFSKKAWIVLFVLLGAAAGGGYLAKVRIIDPYIAEEKAPPAATP